MICKEDEASKKWCPFVRMAGRGVESAENRTATSGILDDGEPGGGTKWNCCIGSACMMWVDKPEFKGGCCGLAR